MYIFSLDFPICARNFGRKISANGIIADGGIDFLTSNKKGAWELDLIMRYLDFGPDIKGSRVINQDEPLTITIRMEPNLLWGSSRRKTDHRAKLDD